LVIPLRAGSEKSVAATKSYLATLGALMHLVSEWSGDKELQSALQTLPQSLAQAWQNDWQTVVDGLKEARNLFVIGRGIGFGADKEAALELIEAVGLHAVSFSAAEVRHGPLAIVGEGFPVLLFAQEDQTLKRMDSLVADFRARNARVFVASESISDSLPVVEGAHPANRKSTRLNSSHVKISYA